jgi:hypothetical protein
VDEFVFHFVRRSRLGKPWECIFLAMNHKQLGHEHEANDFLAQTFFTASAQLIIVQGVSRKPCCV